MSLGSVFHHKGPGTANGWDVVERLALSEGTSSRLADAQQSERAGTVRFARITTLQCCCCNVGSEGNFTFECSTEVHSSQVWGQNTVVKGNCQGVDGRAFPWKVQSSGSVQSSD